MPDEDDLDRAVAANDRELVPWLFERWSKPMVDGATQRDIDM
jgi:hypothetical protein